MADFFHGNDGYAESTMLGGHTSAQVTAWTATKSAPAVDVGGFHAGSHALDKAELGRDRVVGTVSFKIKHSVAVPDLGIAVLTLRSRSTVPYVQFLGSAIFTNLPISRRIGDEADTVEFGFELYSDWTGPTLVEA